MLTMEVVYNWFWSENFWFSDGKSWKDLENKQNSTTYLPQVIDLHWSLPLGVVLLLFRYVFERYILTPLGYWVGVKERKPVKVQQNPILEGFYEKNGITRSNVEAVAKRTDLTVRQVEVWLRQRRKQGVPQDIKKFRDCGWHFVFYLLAFVYGAVILWNKSWLWETKLCWKGWPAQHVSKDVYWYYLIELAFYWSLVFSVVTDHRRKDFTQMIVHHVATIALLYFSWIMNFVRIGTLVLIVHDVADVPMAAAKMLKYCRKKLLCDVMFGVFILVWIVSRLMFYPFKILYSTSFEVYLFLKPFYAYYLFNGLLIILQILHLIWSYLIARIAVLTINSGKLQDVRSDTSDIGSD